MAIGWLDLARYADTNGGTVDTAREMWAYRDWVIQALNDNMPFDQFTIEQLAGDLLPNPSFSQKVATGFLRNEASQIEICFDQLGTILLVDRVNTVSTVWLGSTFACAQCHDHKYDPLTQRQYYQMLAFFNTHLKDPPWWGSGIDPRGNTAPVLAMPTPAQSARIASLKDQSGRVEIEIQRLIADTPLPDAPSDDPAESFPLWEQSALVADGRDLPAPVREVLRAEPTTRTAREEAILRAYFIEHVYAPTRTQFARLHAERDRLRKELTEIKAETTSTMILEQPWEPADTHVLIRGEFTRKGEKVSPAVPDFLPPLPAEVKADRLGFARWLTSPNHPLTARVAVNRIWQTHFGTGLVPTGDDFGSQGEPPTHPELLDWLAVRFVESGWDVKQLHKLIVSSATYRQSGRVTPGLLEVDPDNRLYGRWPRTRLPAETIRDNALAISGLLDRRMGGPSVRPYQPEGLWEAVRHPGNFTAQEYVQSHGGDLYRRGVYVYVKRTMPHPSMSIFGAPNRDVCTVRRDSANTALQALALLNDTTALECARGAAARMIREGGSAADERLAYGFRLCTARRPRAHEMDVLRRVYAAELARFQADPQAAVALLGVGESPVPRDTPATDLAALTVVANLLLNLDETITLE